MNILSLFDGIGCARIALDNIGIKPTAYYASETDRRAISIATKRYDDIIHLGDVEKIEYPSYDFCEMQSEEVVKYDGDGEPYPSIELSGDPDLQTIDLLIGGSPCTSLSIASGRKESGLDHGQSMFFWEYVRVLREVMPAYFVLENVRMRNADRDIMSEALFGVQPILINSALLTAQSRRRYYWVGKRNGHTYDTVPISQPADKRIVLSDVIGDCAGVEMRARGKFNGSILNRDKAHTLTSSSIQTNMHILRPLQIGKIDGKNHKGYRIYSMHGKSCTLCANGGGMGANTGHYKIDMPDGDYVISQLTPEEAEMLQGIPRGYTSGVSKTQRFKMIGNAFTVPVIEHILRRILL